MIYRECTNDDVVMTGLLSREQYILSLYYHIYILYLIKCLFFETERGTALRLPKMERKERAARSGHEERAGAPKLGTTLGGEREREREREGERERERERVLFMRLFPRCLIADFC